MKSSWESACNDLIISKIFLTQMKLKNFLRKTKLTKQWTISEIYQQLINILKNELKKSCLQSEIFLENDVKIRWNIQLIKKLRLFSNIILSDREMNNQSKSFSLTCNRWKLISSVSWRKNIRFIQSWINFNFHCN